MHIKFLQYGRGSAAHAAAYVLDTLDHQGIERAGIDVLRGDANTFNAICNASPHEWKYTSGVIAWSKDDAPTPAQIQEVLTEFEKHAFAGLDPSQYHLFAVQHTDDDGSKHIHVLVPRIILTSGRAFNIAPPKHESHFDSLRNYFNTKYEWASPADPLLMKFTQDPNHIAKLNKHAKRILPQQKFESLTKKQFAHAINNYLLTLVSNQTLKNRADIVAHLKELNDINSVREGKDYLSVTLHDGTKHRLKGAFYNAEFESNAYAEHIRRAAEIRRTPDELAAAVREAEQLQSAYRAKRAAYHRKRYPFKPPEADSRDYRCESQLDFERDRQLISQALKAATMDYLRALKAIEEQISNTDISKLQPLSVSIQTLQSEIDKKISNISIDQKSIQAQIQVQVKRAIVDQEEQMQHEILSLISSKLSIQRAWHIIWGSITFGLLMLLMIFYMSYQSNTNLKTIQAQKQIIQQNSQTIQSQINYLNSIRR